jgi:hypothetical protein
MGLVFKLRPKALEEEANGHVSYVLVIGITGAVLGVLMWAVLALKDVPRQQTDESHSVFPGPRGPPGMTGPAGPPGQCDCATITCPPGPPGADAPPQPLLEASCIPPTVRFETIEGLKEQYLDSIAFEGKIKRHNNR